MRIKTPPGILLIFQAAFCCAPIIRRVNCQFQSPELAELWARRQSLDERALPGGAHLRASQPEGQYDACGDPDDPGKPGNRPRTLRLRQHGEQRKAMRKSGKE